LKDWLKILEPKEIVKDIHAIDFKRLKKQGISALLLDIDDTLIPRIQNDVSPQVFEWVVSRKEEGFKLCLTSNSRHPLRVKYIADTLGVPSIHLSLKPLPFSFWNSMQLLGSTPQTTAMIGDQLFMDILGANLLGIYSIFVEHMSAETFLPRIWMRQAEEWVLKLNPAGLV
jgi:HAD superfamily phosphatase (TIGR01668 family)